VIAECRGGQAGFYFYLTFDDVETAEDSRFFHYLARTTGQPGIDEPDGSKAPRVVYLPGEFCVHPEGALAAVGRRQLRVSYGFEEIERIEEAIGYMAEAAAYAREAAGTS